MTEATKSSLAPEQRLLEWLHLIDDACARRAAPPIVHVVRDMALDATAGKPCQYDVFIERARSAYRQMGIVPPIDLATCDLPVEVMYGDWKPAKLLQRYEHECWIKVDGEAGCLTTDLSKLRPLDAPAPAPDQSAEIERFKSALTKIEGMRDVGITACLMRGIAAKALASTAPTCPPGHIMIGDRAVPEPMREAPGFGARYFVANPIVGDLSNHMNWSGHHLDKSLLQRGLCHLTREAAETHARALIAVSGGM